MEPSPSKSQQQTTPSPERQKALLTLLADDDAAVAKAIREQLVGGGEPTIAWLRLHLLHDDPHVRQRVREIVDQHAAAQADIAFLQFCSRHGEHFDLEEAIWCFVRTRHPNANVAAYRAQLDEWAEDARPFVEAAEDGSRVVLGLNLVLFQRLGFKGNSENYYDPANSYLDTVMDRRRGIPITLCCIYQFVARRLGLPVVGIGMPGHFLCRYQTAHEELLIDPFHGGNLVSRSEARRRLEHFSISDTDAHLEPVSSRRCLQRVIANLHIIHKERRDASEVARLQRYLVLLSR
jgi:regulator of sirC expression with transglutaminase-like and TPR domain